MPLKKQTFKDDEIVLFDEAILSKRGEYWQMRMWLTKEKKYARFSLQTRNKDTAIDKAKKRFHQIKKDEDDGKTYFSKTTKQGVEEYLQQRKLDVEAELIVKGRYSTIKTHLEHWLDFIHRDTKLKELERTDCENYYHSRTKTKKKLNVSATTVLNEQSTINAMMLWLYKRKETNIEAFDFKPIKLKDTGNEANRRSALSETELGAFRKATEEYINEAKKDLTDPANLSKAVIGYYLLISSITGMRRGEQLQLTWENVEWENVPIQQEEPKDKKKEVQEAAETLELVKVRVLGQTSKVGKTREFMIEDWGYFNDLYNILYPIYKKKHKGNKDALPFVKTLVFSVNGLSQITPRALSYHFDRLLVKAKIERISLRDLVPYSLRHSFITLMVNQQFSPDQVADFCGTSITQIDKTYYHQTREKMIRNAAPAYHYQNGLLVLKQKRF